MSDHARNAAERLQIGDMQIEQCESWGKHVLSIWTGREWAPLHTDYYKICARMQKVIAQAIANATAELRVENEKLDVQAACWRSFKNMCDERGFAGPYPGGIVRWAQDQIDATAELTRQRDEAKRAHGTLRNGVEFSIRVMMNDGDGNLPESDKDLLALLDGSTENMRTDLDCLAETVKAADKPH